MFRQVPLRRDVEENVIVEKSDARAGETERAKPKNKIARAVEEGEWEAARGFNARGAEWGERGSAEKGGRGGGVGTWSFFSRNQSGRGPAARSFLTNRRNNVDARRKKGGREG